MKLQTLRKAVGATTYPGRGIVIGKSKDGKKAVIAYFIMGRSVNSRNRIFSVSGDGIRTEAFDPSQMKDPSLVIYAPVRVYGSTTVVTNGDQTDTIYDSLKAGGSFEDALRTREFEPDAPNFTPRISGVATVKGGKLDYKLSILKSSDGNPAQCQRQFFDYPNPVAGEGHFIHTYVTDGSPIPSFVGEPERVSIPDDIDILTWDIWDNLDENNRISLYVSYTDLESGAEETRLINKNC